MVILKGFLLGKKDTVPVGHCKQSELRVIYERPQHLSVKMMVNIGELFQSWPYQVSEL
jgi:hypothetical protein